MVELLTVTTGKACTTKLAVFVLTQPMALVPLTVYVVLTVGVGVRVPVLLPVLHVYVDAPLAVKVAVFPIQMPGLLILITGEGLTVIVPVALLVHEKVLAPVTVYCVVVNGDCVIEGVKAPVFQV
jgi:hypothetical protein